MARYIDADALIEMLNNKAKIDLEMGLYNHGALTQSFIKFVERQPTADVVPKSEVEKLKAELEHYHKANLRQSLIIGQMDLTHRQFLKELDEIFKEHKEGFYCDWYLYSRYDELKNKYKEQKENGSDDERPNRRNV